MSHSLSFELPLNPVQWSGVLKHLTLVLRLTFHSYTIATQSRAMEAARTVIHREDGSQ